MKKGGREGGEVVKMFQSLTNFTIPGIIPFAKKRERGAVGHSSYSFTGSSLVTLPIHYIGKTFTFSLVAACDELSLAASFSVKTNF